MHPVCDGQISLTTSTGWSNHCGQRCLENESDTERVLPTDACDGEAHLVRLGKWLLGHCYSRELCMSVLCLAGHNPCVQPGCEQCEGDGVAPQGSHSWCFWNWSAWRLQVLLGRQGTAKARWDIHTRSCVLKRSVSGVLELAVHLSLAFYETRMYLYYFSVTFLLKNVKLQVYSCDVFVTKPQLLQSHRSCAEGNLGRLRSA